MPVTAVVGAGWGDEGKGKTTDQLAGEADYVVRFQGGRNAGHTLHGPGGRLVLHMLPSGVLRPGVVDVLGPGVALDVDALRAELALLAERGLPEPALLVSDRAQVVLPHHPELDRLEEERLGEHAFGSTRAGMAPFYADKAAKVGVRVAELGDRERLRERLVRGLEPRQVLLRDLYGRPPVDVDALVERLAAWGEWLSPFVADTTGHLHGALAKGARILAEGQLGALRDPDHGIHPYTTSSSTLASHIGVGAGLPVRSLDRVVAVVKAYSSCVGAGPFVSELHDARGDALRERGGEYGATTGRPRRVGWLDAVALRYGCRLQGATELTLTMLDVLAGLDEVPICRAYAIDGEPTERFPASPLLERARPCLETWRGWPPLAGLRRREQLPAAARAYVDRVEELLETPVRQVSVGPERDAVVPYST